MTVGYTKRVKTILLDQGCTLVRRGKGDHEIWESPISNTRFVVDGKIQSRHLANAVLRQAGIKLKIE